MFAEIGFLVMKDPVETPINERKKRVPGVIGSNAFRVVRQSLCSDLGTDYLSQSVTLPNGDKW